MSIPEYTKDGTNLRLIVRPKPGVSALALYFRLKLNGHSKSVPRAQRTAPGLPGNRTWHPSFPVWYIVDFQ